MRFALLLFLLIPSIAFGDDFAAANQAYTNGDFPEARRLYAKIALVSPAPNAWYNLGNAAFRMGDLGSAALAYERALLLQPGHPEAAANLKFIRTRTAARVPWAEWQEKAVRYAAQPWGIWTSVALSWIGFLLLGAAVFRRRSARGTIAAGVLIVLLGASALGGLLYLQRSSAQIAVVTSEQVDARLEPADRASLAENLSAGSRVQLLSVQGDWTYCALPAGGRGWIPAKSIERIADFVRQ
jgi:tetratricopeptide (TPR) repeat protein